MRDLCLKFANSTEMEQVFLDAGFSEMDGGLYHPSITLDVVAVIYEPRNPGMENTKYVAVPGYHANIRVTDDLLDLTAFNKFVVEPKTPIRVWA
ncbi:hypothetical protein MKW06_001765 [Escherichia coli]|nr:hypothetical protein [Escherichia coli]